MSSALGLHRARLPNFDAGAIHHPSERALPRAHPTSVHLHRSTARPEATFFPTA
jgi:hypothetical protein